MIISIYIDFICFYFPFVSIHWLMSYNFGRKSEFTVSAECTNIFNARLYDNFKMQKPGRAFAVKFGYNFIK